jgi:hypothetical protein
MPNRILARRPRGISLMASGEDEGV